MMRYGAESIKAMNSTIGSPELPACGDELKKSPDELTFSASLKASFRLTTVDGLVFDNPAMKRSFLYTQMIDLKIVNVEKNFTKNPLICEKFAANPRIALNELVKAKYVESSIVAMLPMVDTTCSMLWNAPVKELLSVINGNSTMTFLCFTSRAFLC